MIYLIVLLIVSVVINLVLVIRNNLIAIERNDAYAELRFARSEIDGLLNQRYLARVAGRKDRRAHTLGLIQGART